MGYRSASRTLRALAKALALAGVLTVTERGVADPSPVPASPLRATLTCAQASEPGRMRCEVEAKTAGASIQWADVELTEVPPLIAPLRGRIGPKEATTKEPGMWRFALALVAKRAGAGTVSARVRAVACVAGDACSPMVAEVRTEVRVGP